MYCIHVYCYLFTFHIDFIFLLFLSHFFLTHHNFNLPFSSLIVPSAPHTVTLSNSVSAAESTLTLVNIPLNPTPLTPGMHSQLYLLMLTFHFLPISLLSFLLHSWIMLRVKLNIYFYFSCYCNSLLFFFQLYQFFLTFSCFSCINCTSMAPLENKRLTLN